MPSCPAGRDARKAQHFPWVELALIITEGNGLRSQDSGLLMMNNTKIRKSSSQARIVQSIQLALTDLGEHHQQSPS